MLLLQPMFLVSRHLKDRRDRFLLGAGDESASVDDDDVRLGRVAHGGVAVLDEGVAEHIGVHLIFRTSERRYAYFTFQIPSSS